MFNKKDKNLEKALAKALAPIEKVAGDVIRGYGKNVQEDAWMVAYIAYCEGADILKTLASWHYKERLYQRKIISFTRGRPSKRDKTEFLRIKKEYN
jgi:hypothetical protein